ncbi:hypothetical protein DPMN_016778 [Dreissena polymorpha]|uniref:Uncharacterized protein n=1 Tax=Dreissena polymorpha TaxID=45954 RepID=A0A9D4NBW8_DREPO|nr:hypothetical protein DPMN_016778 [Dreissena polymorpha]
MTHKANTLQTSNDLHLVDSERIKNIADFVEKSGVIEALKQQIDLRSKLGQQKPLISPNTSRQNLPQKVPQPNAVIEKRRRVPTPPPEMETIAAPVRGYFRRTSSPPPPQIGFQNKTPLSSQRAISDIESNVFFLPHHQKLSQASVESADVVQLPQYVSRRRFVRPLSGKRHMFPSNKESNDSSLEGLPPRKANTSCELQTPHLLGRLIQNAQHC